MKKHVLIAWFLMILGAFLIFEGIALFITGCYSQNFLIILTGAVGVGIGVYLMKCGHGRRKKYLAAKGVVNEDKKGKVKILG